MAAVSGDLHRGDLRNERVGECVGRHGVHEAYE